MNLARLEQHFLHFLLELDRLRTEVADNVAEIGGLHSVVEGLRAERDRLRAEMRDTEAALLHQRNLAVALRAEKAELVAAAESVCDFDWSDGNCHEALVAITSLRAALAKATATQTEDSRCSETARR